MTTPPDYTKVTENNLTFYLNRNSVYCQFYASDGRLQTSAGLKVDPIKYKAGKLTKDQRTHLSRLQGVVYQYEADARQAGRKTAKAEVEALLMDATGRKIIHRVSKTAFSAYFDQCLKDVESGLILNDGKKYSKSFIKIASVINRKLPKLKLGAVPVEKITEEDLRLFGAELTQQGYTKNTVATYFDPVLSFITGGRNSGRHKGPLLVTRAFRIYREDIDHGVYLTPEEQELITQLPYEGDEAMWRDAFILGCNLGMRHSDLSRLTPEHRSKDVVNINTQKTGNPVWVPLNMQAREIWDKYSGKFNIPTLTPFMLFAKKLGEDAGLNKSVLFSRTEGGVKIERHVPKYELMGSHTMRRSFSTNAYRAGVPIPSIMKVTGHKSAVSFHKYIRLSDEEHATLLAEHTFFK